MGSMHQPSALIGKWTLTNLNKSAPAFKAPTWDEMRVKNHWELKAESYLFFFVFFLFFLQVSPYACNIATRKTIFDASPGLYTNWGKAQAYVYFTCRYQNPIHTRAKKGFIFLVRLINRQVFRWFIVKDSRITKPDEHVFFDYSSNGEHLFKGLVYIQE